MSALPHPGEFVLRTWDREGWKPAWLQTYVCRVIAAHPDGTLSIQPVLATDTYGMTYRIRSWVRCSILARVRRAAMRTGRAGADRA